MDGDHGDPGGLGRPRGKPRLVAVSAVCPSPARDGYRLRVAGLLAELAREWSILLVCPELDAPVAGIEEWRSLPGRAGAVRAVPLGDAHDARVRDAVLRAAAQWEPQALLLWPGTEHAALRAPGAIPAVADRIDCSSLTQWRALRVQRRFPRGLRDWLDSLRYERNLVRGVRAVVAAGCDDARWLARIGGRRVGVVPNGVSLAPAAAPQDEAALPTVAFTGVLDYEPNATAALYLAREIWPRVRARLPDAQLCIAGRRPTQPVRALAQQPGIHVCADVDDMERVLRRAWLAAAPMQSGSGVKNKILEAWALARPVVLSPLAANGLELDAQARSWIAADAPAAAERIVRWLRFPEERRRAGAHARTLAAAHHSWRGAAQNLSGLLRAVRVTAVTANRIPRNASAERDPPAPSAAQKALFHGEFVTKPRFILRATRSSAEHGPPLSESVRAPRSRTRDETTRPRGR